jgi:hypothetical protein
LSPFDAYWVTLPPVRRVFLYRSPPSLLPFTDVVAALRSSLERVLPAFHPFAGVLTSSPDSQELSIVLPDGEGACSVALIEAETDLEFDRLVEEYDEEALRQLAPDIRRDELPAPVMAAQVRHASNYPYFLTISFGSAAFLKSEASCAGDGVRRRRGGGGGSASLGGRWARPVAVLGDVVGGRGRCHGGPGVARVGRAGASA